jgi:hypothetical protein
LIILCVPSTAAAGPRLPTHSTRQLGGRRTQRATGIFLNILTPARGSAGVNERARCCLISPLPPQTRPVVGRSEPHEIEVARGVAGPDRDKIFTYLLARGPHAQDRFRNTPEYTQYLYLKSSHFYPRGANRCASAFIILFLSSFFSAPLAVRVEWLRGLAR